MTRLYSFIGPDRLLGDAEREIPRHRLADHAHAPRLIADLGVGWRLPSEETLTFIVDERGALWVAERHVEHIACARGAPVLAAGELTLELSSTEIVALAATNQSTGYCPEPESWPALAAALDAAAIERPDRYAHAFRFGRCRSCRGITILKGDEPSCLSCGGALEPPWPQDAPG